MKETARTISMKMSLHLADGVFAWLKEKGITSLDSIQQDILASRYHKVFFEPDEKMNPDEKCEFFGVLIDVAEDFLAEYKKTHKTPCYIENTGTEDIPHKKALNSFEFYCGREEDYDACES